MRGMSNPFNGGSDYVERQLGESYRVVKEVQSNLASIETAAANIQSIIDAAPAAEQVTLALSIIENLAAGVIYDTTAEGLDPVTGVLSGEFFATWEGGRLRIYLNQAGAAVQKIELVTTTSALLPIYDDLASTDSNKGAALVAATGGVWTSVQGFISHLLSSVGSTLVGFGQSTVASVLLRTVEYYGAKGDNTTDDTTAIQAMINDVGYFTLQAKTYRITNTLTVPSHATTTKSIGAKFSGQGMEKSVLRCDGMAGKAAISSALATGLYRVTMSDFSISGDAETCIGFVQTVGVGSQLYQSEFRNMVLSCAGASAFKATSHFSTSWYNIHTYSTSGHGFEIQGGNSTVLVNCYAHNSGAGKAGYRIFGGATLICCNGVDSAGDIWGDFGAATAAGDPYNGQFRITMIGCNVEDWDNDAIILRYTGSITFETCTFTAKATGTFNSVISQPLTGSASLWKIVERNSVYVTKGSTLSGASRVIMNSGPELIRSNGNLFADIYRADQTLLYTIPKEGISSASFGVTASKFAALDADRYYGFTQQVPTTWTANATTFAVTSKNTVKTANTGATSFATATGGTEGQELSLIVRDAFTTVNHGTGANAFNLKGAANLACASGDVLKFVHNGTGWKQI